METQLSTPESSQIQDSSFQLQEPTEAFCFILFGLMAVPESSRRIIFKSGTKKHFSKKIK